MHNDNTPLTLEQIAQFEERLKKMKEEIIEESQRLLKGLGASDPAVEYEERASIEAETQLECMILEQEQRMLWAINNALEKIQDGTYGYCEETGEPIDIRRLEAYPMATLSIKGYNQRKRISLYGSRTNSRPHF